MITDNNEKLFNLFLDFPKPILVAANGPAIGATVTSAALCDGIIASERATFLTPFSRLCVAPEVCLVFFVKSCSYCSHSQGCSSVHFQRLMGEAGAERMLVRGDKISAEEALNLGLVMRVVKHEELLTTAQVTLILIG